MTAPVDQRKHIFPGIEALRTLAAMVVLVQHGLLLTVDDPDRYEVLGPMSGIAVVLFFVISGFLLIPPVVERGPLFFQTFVTRRIRRLAPLYMFVGAVTAVALAAAGQAPSLGAVLSHLAFASIYTGDFIFGSAWTLCVEAAFILLVLPVACVLGRLEDQHHRNVSLVAAGILAFGAATIMANALGRGGLKLAPIANLLPFFVGGALARCAQPRSQQRWWICAVALAAWVPPLWMSVPAILWLPLTTVGAALLILAAGSWKSVFSRPGRYSYGLYLWHLPIILIYQAYFLEGAAPTWPILVSVSFVIALTVASAILALASYRWIEVPAMARRPTPSS